MTDTKATASNGNENPKKSESASVALIAVDPRERDPRRGTQTEPPASAAGGDTPPPRSAPPRDAAAGSVAI